MPCCVNKLHLLGVFNFRLGPVYFWPICLVVLEKKPENRCKRSTHANTYIRCTMSQAHVTFRQGAKIMCNQGKKFEIRMFFTTAVKSQLMQFSKVKITSHYRTKRAYSKHIRQWNVKIKNIICKWKLSCKKSTFKRNV